MRLRQDTGGEVGVFEDLQTLVVIVVGLMVLLGSTLVNWSSFEGVQEERELHDEAEHIVDQIEATKRWKAINNYGSEYDEFYLRQSDLAQVQNNTRQFNENIRSDFPYRIEFDDLEIPDGEHCITDDPRNETSVYSYYVFGEDPPEDADVVTLQVQYALVMDVYLGGLRWDVNERHPCLMTVMVWR